MKRKFGMFTVPKRKCLLLNPRFWMILCMFVDSVSIGKASALQRTIYNYESSDSRNYQPNRAYPDYSNDPYFNPSSYNNHHFRETRNATDKPTEFLNHATIIAHIANGIALQAGLMNGKIQVDDVVGELLNLGSVKPSELAKFQTDPLKEFATDLKELPKKFLAVDFEEQVLNWDKWFADAESIKDFKFDKIEDIPGVSKYFDDIANLQSKLDFPKLKEVTEASDLDLTFSNLEGSLASSELKNTVKNQIANSLSYVAKYSNTYFAVLKNLKTSIDNCKQFSILRTGPELFAPVDAMIRLMSAQRQAIAGNKDKVESIKKNIGEMVKYVNGAKTTLQDLTTINDVSKSEISRKVGEFTPGFSNGVDGLSQLPEDTRSKWLGQLLGFTGSKLNPLADGLSPMLKLKERLIGLPDKLKSVTTSNVNPSLETFRETQKSLSEVSEDSADAVVSINEQSTCFRKPKTLEKYFKTAGDFVTNVKSLKAKLDQLDKIAESVSLESETQEWIKSLGFTKITEMAEVEKELPALFDKLKVNPNLQNIKQRFAGFQTLLTSIDGENLKTTLENNMKSIDKVGMTADFLKSVIVEKSIHDCLKKHSEKIKNTSQAIKLIQKLRIFGTKGVDEVVAAATTVSKFSGSLSGVLSVQEEMKKSASNFTEGINRMPRAIEHSKTIGQSVASLQHALALKEMESEIAQLNTIGATVTAEVHKVSDQEQRKAIEEHWGDHKKDVAELEKSIAEIKALLAKLDKFEAKNLEDFGAILKDLSTVSDSKLKADEKSKALDLLISQDKIDPKVKADLEESKKTLDKLAALDLQFSSHQKQYQSAPGAFKALHDFLTDFLAIDRKETVVIESEIPWLIIGCAAGGLFLFCALIVGLSIWCDRRRADEGKKEAKKNSNLITERETEASAEEKAAWARERRYASRDEAQIAHGQLFKLMEVQAVEGKSSNKLEKKCRHSKIPCNEKTMVMTRVDKFWRKSIAVHANWIYTAAGKAFIATQGPIKDEEGKKDTDVDFWNMVIYRKVEYIVMLCHFFEGGVRRCGQYFSEELNGTAVCGPYTIKTAAEEEVLLGNVVKRKLEIYNKKNKLLKTVTHYQFVTWPDFGIPQTHTAALELLKLVNSFNPVVVHCSGGAGRTVTFIGLKYIYDEICKNPKVNYPDMCTKLRECRWGGIQNVKQSAWLEAGVIRQLGKSAEIDTLYDELMAYVPNLITQNERDANFGMKPKVVDE